MEQLVCSRIPGIFKDSKEITASMDSMVSFVSLRGTMVLPVGVQGDLVIVNTFIDVRRCFENELPRPASAPPCIGRCESDVEEKDFDIATDWIRKCDEVAPRVEPQTRTVKEVLCENMAHKMRVMGGNVEHRPAFLDDFLEISTRFIAANPPMQMSRALAFDVLIRYHIMLSPMGCFKQCGLALLEDVCNLTSGTLTSMVPRNWTQISIHRAVRLLRMQETQLAKEILFFCWEPWCVWHVNAECQMSEINMALAIRLIAKAQPFCFCLKRLSTHGYRKPFLVPAAPMVVTEPSVPEFGMRRQTFYHNGWKVLSITIHSLALPTAACEASDIFFHIDGSSAL